MINFLKYIFFIFFVLLDISVWLIIQTVPGPVVYKILKFRPWKVFCIQLQEKNALKLKLSLQNIIKTRIYSMNFLSSCLSKSISARIILDLFKIPNILKLSLYVSKNGKKKPHACIEDTESNINFIPNKKENIEIVAVLD